MTCNIDNGAEAIISSLHEPEVKLPEGVHIILPVQTHSANVAVAAGAGSTFADTDALITTDPAIAVGVRTADCLPVLLYAPDIHAAAAVHAGWRGTFARIALRTVERLAAMGAHPESISALLGPCICAGCYEVSAELVEQFRSAGFRHLPEPATGSRPHLDLAALNAETLTEAGLLPANITSTGHCTFHTTLGGSHLYPSWRRTPGTTVRLISSIRLL